MYLRWCARFSLACIVLIELVAGRTDLPGRLVPLSDLGTVLLIEDTIAAPHPDATVLIFGTSRARGAFLPTVMEQRLGLPRGAVLNLAVGGDNIFDASLLYARTRQRVAGPKLVILQVDAFQFNAGGGPSDRFRRYSTLSERVTSYRGAARLRLLVDWVFRAGTVTPTLGYYARSWLTHGAAPPSAGLDRYGRLAVVSLANDHDSAEFTPGRLRFWLDWQYAPYQPSRGLERGVLSLIEAARRDGARVYLVQLPTATAYDTLLRVYPGDPAAAFRVWLAETAAPRTDGIGAWTLPAEAGLTESDFRDWGHLNVAGAVAWSDFFAQWLGEREPAMFPAAVSSGVHRGT